MGRADLRKQGVVTEVNPLGTAFLRADLLAEPGRTQVRRDGLGIMRRDAALNLEPAYARRSCSNSSKDPSNFSHKFGERLKVV